MMGHNIFGLGMPGLYPFAVIGILLAAWSIAWKGWSLWTAAGKRDKVWFVVLLVINTAGILDIFYIYVFSKQQRGAKKEASAEHSHSETHAHHEEGAHHEG